MRLLFSFLLLVLQIVVLGQKSDDAKNFGDLINADSLKNKLFKVASREFEGRETGSPGIHRAASYIENYFRTIGLKPGIGNLFQMNFPVYRDSLTALSLTINNKSFGVSTDFDANFFENNTSLVFDSQIVFVGYGISDELYDDYKNLDTKDKIVLALDGYPSDLLQAEINRKGFNPYAKQDAAKAHGASALMIIANNFPRPQLQQRGELYQQPEGKTDRVNTYYISPTVAKFIMGGDFDKINKRHPQTNTYNKNISLQFNKSTEKMAASNVLGYLEGSDLQDQLVIISAHYDHVGKYSDVIYYGADDDGSGTVGLLEIAKAFARAKAQGRGPRRSILFLAHSGEEEGLWGSKLYADNPVFPLNKTIVDLNMDMIGRVDTAHDDTSSHPYVYVVGDNRLSSDLTEVVESANKKYTDLVLDRKFNSPHDPENIFERSDHYSYASKHIPILFFYDGSHIDYHKPSDTPDKINYNLLAKRAQLVFYCAWDIANRKKRLAVDMPLTVR